jgi:hypothetical protein
VYSFQTHHLARPLKACLTFNLKKDKIKYIWSCLGYFFLFLGQNIWYIWINCFIT